MNKQKLIEFMHVCGFNWIEDIALINGVEIVASKMTDCDEMWWRPLEVEGSGFTQLFKGSIKQILMNNKITLSNE